ncbi:MAG: hypothetical protein ACKVG1_15575 [Rhodospirillales bacterium]
MSKKPRKKTQKKVNLLGVAESVLVANVVTEGLFNCNALEFITGRGANNNQSTGYYPSNKDNVISLPELLGFQYNALQNTSGTTPLYRPFTSSGAMEVIKANLKTNLFPMMGGLIAVPLAFRVGSKLTTKPRSTANKLLTYTGLGVKV